MSFRYDLIERTPNTFAAHRLVALAQGQGLADAMVRRLLSAYFAEGRDIGDGEVLVGLAAEVGLPADRVVSALSDDAQRAEVRQALERGRAIGVSGVPTFVAAGRHAISGAQPAEVLAEFFRRYDSGQESA